MYFNGLCKRYELSNVNIKITSEAGSDPLKIVNFAIAECKDYDKVFCVFDRDNHANFDEAINLIKYSNEGRSGKLRAVVSYPCFEVWVLLHLNYTTSPFGTCANVVKKIKENFRDYNKSWQDIYAKLEPMTDTAINNAARLDQHNRKTNSHDPATGIYHLVQYLQNLKKRTNRTN